MKVKYYIVLVTSVDFKSFAESKIIWAKSFYNFS